jgi:hypothetical protein
MILNDVRFHDNDGEGLALLADNGSLNLHFDLPYAAIFEARLLIQSHASFGNHP